MQHRTLFRSILLILIIHVIALAINMVSDDAEQWIENLLGPKYLVVISVVLTISLVILYVLEQPTTKRKESSPTTTANQPQQAVSGRTEEAPDWAAKEENKRGQKSSPQPPTPEAYQAIESAIAADQLEQACEQMRTIAVYRTTALGFQGRLTELQNRVKKGTLTADQRTASRNEIREQLLQVISEWTPTEVLIEEATATAVPSEGFYRTIIDPKDRWLRPEAGQILGRTVPLARLAEWLNDPEVPSILVHALAGTGKTELCRAALAQYLADEQDRIVHYLELEHVSSSDALLNVLGELAGVPEADRRSPRVLARLAEMPPALFYLDNLETTLEDEDTFDLLKRLQRLNGHRWLASARPLAGSWERTLDLDVLTPEVAMELFRRTWLLNRSFWPESPSAELTVFLDQALGHHPLSIVLTASHSRTFSEPDEVITAWHRQSDRLLTRFTGGKAEGRLHNWQASLALSLDRLRTYPDACRLWCLTMLFQEGIEGQVLEKIYTLGIATPADRAELIRRNLVRNRSGRLEVLPPVAEFIRIALRSGADAALSERQLFTDSLALAEHPESSWLHRLDTLEFFADRVTTYPDLKRVDAVTSNGDYLQQPFRSRKVLGRLIRQLDPDRQPNFSVNINYHLGELAFRLGENDPARAHYARAAELYRKTGDEQGLANVEFSLGELAFLLGENDPARAHYARAAELYRKTGDEQGLANVELSLGELAFLLGENDPARAHYARAAELYRKTGSELGLANVERNLGELAFLLGENDPARAHYARAVELYRKTGSELGLANVERNLGELAFRLGENDPARAHYARAAELYRKTGDEQGLANVEFSLGELAFRLGENDPARAHYARAAELYRKTGDEQGLANVEFSLGELAFRLGENDPARAHYARAAELYRKTGSEQGLANVERNLGELAFRLGENDPARAHYARAAELYRKTGSEQGLANVERNLGELAFRLGENDPARAHYARAAELYRKTGDMEGQADIELNLGRLAFQLEDNGGAKTYFERATELYRKTGYKFGVGKVDFYFAILQLTTRQFSTAYNNFDRALRCYRQVESPYDIAETLLYLVDTARQGELMDEQEANPAQLAEAKALIDRYGLTYLEEKYLRLGVK